jgi:short-subunit dehydrogenase involved in D-alanine esterification of teichoic acids
MRTPARSGGQGKTGAGGSSGIGLGIEPAFADVGMKVVLGYRTEKHLEEALAYCAFDAQRIDLVSHRCQALRA